MLPVDPTHALLLILLLLLAALALCAHRCRERFGGRAALSSMDCYLINMDRNPDRLRHFKQQFSASDLVDLSFTRFPGVDGSRLDIQGLVTPKAYREIVGAEKDGFRTKHYQLTRGAVGCALSHLGVWRALLNSDKEAALIFEDDVVLDPRILSKLSAQQQVIPDDWDIVLLGYFCNKCTRRAGYRQVLRFFGCHAYVISRRAVDKILRYGVLPIGQQIDALLSEMTEEGKLNVYCFWDKLAWQNNTNFKTEIQVPLKASAAVDPWVKLRDDGDGV